MRKVIAVSLTADNQGEMRPIPVSCGLITATMASILLYVSVDCSNDINSGLISYKIC